MQDPGASHDAQPRPEALSRAVCRTTALGPTSGLCEMHEGAYLSLQASWPHSWPGLGHPAHQQASLKGRRCLPTRGPAPQTPSAQVTRDLSVSIASSITSSQMLCQRVEGFSSRQMPARGHCTLGAAQLGPLIRQCTTAQAMLSEHLALSATLWAQETPQWAAPLP